MLPTSIRPGISRCPRGQCSHRGVGRRTPSGEATNSHGDSAEITNTPPPLSEHCSESSHLR